MKVKEWSCKASVRIRMVQVKLEAFVPLTSHGIANSRPHSHIEQRDVVSAVSETLDDVLPKATLYRHLRW